MQNFWLEISRILNFRLFTIGEAIITPASLLAVVIAFVLSIWLSMLFRRALLRISKHNVSLTEETVYTLSRLSHYAIVFFGILTSLIIVGIDFSSIVIAAGALGVGIGFGLQSIANNFVSGLIILFERNLKVGDYVVLQSGIEGTIREINVRSTLISTTDNLDIIVPNAEFINGQVVNWTLRDRFMRIHIPFGVAYGSDKELVRKAAIEAAMNVPFTLADGEKHEPLVWLVGFGDSSLNFELVVWVNPLGVKKPGAMRASYYWELETSLKKHQIQIPFPQRDLHWVSGKPDWIDVKNDKEQ